MTANHLLWWVIGLAIPLAAGTRLMPAVKGFLEAFVKATDVPGDLIPGSVTGFIERFFFTLLVAFDVSGTGVAMMGWISVKMASGWNTRARSDGEEWAKAVGKSFIALLAGLVSMTFALIGGLVIREFGLDP